MNPIKSTIKCCGCMVLSQLICLLFSIGSFVVFILLFKFYAIEWGQDQIRKGLNLPMDTDLSNLSADTKAANNCSGCVFGSNTQWPTNTTGGLHFLDTSAGPTASAAMATSLAVAGAVGTGSMLWASFFPSAAAAAASFASGFYEMTHLFEQAQFIGIMAQLQLRGAPEFLFQFSKELAWTNFNIPKSIQEKSPFARRLADLLTPETKGETGVPKYAAMIGVDPKNLYWYTLATFGVLIAVFHALFIVFVCLLTLCKKQSFGELARKLYRKVIWAGVLVLLLCQYIIAMTGSFYVYNYGFNASPQEKDSRYIYGLLSLILMIGFALVFGVFIVGANRQELKDVGTYEHEQRPFSAKYSAYYDEYNFDNRFFFLPRLLLAVITGCIVGCVYDPMWQILSIMGITLLYLALLIIREPNLLRFLYYIGISSVFMKIVLLCMMLMLVKDDYFPQVIRDKVAYGIIGVNMFVFFLLFLRQAYLIVHKLIMFCKNRNNKDGREADLNHEPSPAYNQINSSRVENGRQANSRPQGQFNNNNKNNAAIGATQQRNTQQNNQPPVDPYKGYDVGRRQHPLAPAREAAAAAAPANATNQQEDLYQGNDAGRRQNPLGPSRGSANVDGQQVEPYKGYDAGRRSPPLGGSRGVGANASPATDPYKGYDAGRRSPPLGAYQSSGIDPYKGYDGGRRSPPLGRSGGTKAYSGAQRSLAGLSRGISNEAAAIDVGLGAAAGVGIAAAAAAAASRKEENTSPGPRGRGVSVDIDGDDHEFDASIGANNMKRNSNLYATAVSNESYNTSSNGLTSAPSFRSAISSSENELDDSYRTRDSSSLSDSESSSTLDTSNFACQDSLLLDTSALDGIAAAYLEKAGESAMTNGENVIGEHEEDDEDHEDEENKEADDDTDSRALLEKNYNEVRENDLGIDEEIDERLTAGTMNDVHGDDLDDDDEYELDTNVHVHIDSDMEDDASDSDLSSGDRGSIPLLSKQFSRDSVFSDYNTSHMTLGNDGQTNPQSLNHSDSVRSDDTIDF